MYSTAPTDWAISILGSTRLRRTALYILAAMGARVKPRQSLANPRSTFFGKGRMHLFIHTDIYIYIYSERERERDQKQKELERERDKERNRKKEREREYGNKMCLRVEIVVDAATS